MHVVGPDAPDAQLLPAHSQRYDVVLAQVPCWSGAVVVALVLAKEYVAWAVVQVCVTLYQVEELVVVQEFVVPAVPVLVVAEPQGSGTVVVLPAVVQDQEVAVVPPPLAPELVVDLEVVRLHRPG